MCRSFEVISGKVNKGNVEYLKGICKAAVDAGKDVTILDIPVICSYLEKKILMGICKRKYIFLLQRRGF